MIDACPNLVDAGVDPGEWARRREEEGWPVISASDHLWDPGRAYPHWAVTLTQFAAATTRPVITSSFANNLLRSPVEFAQAALALQRASGGRFEAGLGAGWSRGEVEGIGATYPSAGERAGRYAEAMTIVRELLQGRPCRFEGRHYDVDVPALGPSVPVAPPLVASVGGPRTIREVVPLVDRVELKPASVATRGGSLDFGTLAGVDRSHLAGLVAQVRAVRDDVPLGVFVMAGCGAHPRLDSLRSALGDGLMGSFVGEPEAVAASIRSLAELGISRVQVTPYTPDTIELLAPFLAGGRADGERPGDDALDVARRFWRIQDDGDYSRLAVLFADDAVLEDPVFGTFRGGGEIAAFLTRMNTEMRARGASFRLVELAGDGGTAWAQWEATTNDGTRTGVGVYRVRDGRLTYYRDYLNA